MADLALTKEKIDKVKSEVTSKVKERLKSDLIECILYGSCARGDFSEDSDVDIALLVRCDRVEVKKYTDVLTDIALIFAIKYFVIINFVCIPYDEYMSKKSWYLYFKNINDEGVVLHG